MTEVSRRGRRRTLAGTSLALVLLASLLVTPPADSFARQNQAGPIAGGGRAVAHRAGGVKVAAAGAPAARLYDLGTDAAEPTLGLVEEGTVFVTATNVDAEPVPSQVDIVRSTDDGETWDVVSPRVGPSNAHFITIDPYLWVDPVTDRLFTIDLTYACSYMSFSDDGGDSWTTNPLACGRPVNDHQTLFGGPPVSSPTVGYDNVLYYCFNDVATSSCTKSLDGGITFSPTGAPPFAGIDPTSGEQGISGIPGFCTGLHGHGVVGSEGTVYLPRSYCTKPVLAISGDEGRTWRVVRVSDMAAVNQTGGGGNNTSVAVDDQGNLYYLFVGADDRLPYLTISRDGGDTWSPAMSVAAPGVKEANLATIAVGAPGKVAIAYYGSESSPGPPFNGSYIDTTWNAYITMSANVLAARPLFFSAPVNPRSDPLVRDRCGPGRCKTVLDFIDVEIGPDGTPWTSLVDSCIDRVYDTRRHSCATNPSRSENFGDRGLVGRLVGGPSLR